MATARRIATIAIRAVLVVAIALTIFIAYGLVNNAWYHVLAVRGGSMEPTISAGDLIVITRPPERIEVGQVLTLQVDGAVVTHRVVKVGPDGTFVTQGDANDTRDDFTANDVHVVGEYRFSLPFVGAVVDLFVSGAWAADTGAIAAGIASSAWDDAATPTSVDPSTGQITWDAGPLRERTARPEPTALATASPTPTTDVTAAPIETPGPTPTPLPTPASSAPAAPSPEPSAIATEAPSDPATPSPAPSPTMTPVPSPTAIPGS